MKRLLALLLALLAATPVLAQSVVQTENVRAEQALFIDEQHDFPNGAKTLDLCTGRRKISRAGDPDCLATA